MCVEASPHQQTNRHQQGVQEFSSWWHYLPCPEVESDSTDKGLHLTRPPSTSEDGCKPRLLPMLLTYRLHIRGSYYPLLGFEQLTEIMKTLLLIRLPIHYKGYKRIQINSQMKKCIGWGSKWRGFSLHGAWGRTVNHESVLVPQRVSSPKKDQVAILWVLWRLHYLVMLE